MAKDVLIRIDRPIPEIPHGAWFVRSVGRDGSFAITRDKAQARRFTAARAAEKIATLTNTKFEFSTCEAPT